ncbi:MAG: flagellin B, partial [Campylobacterales bacterium]|nr:flagellin B [Campylobacterales bacterium]
MSFRINTNVSAMNAHTSSIMNNRSLANSLEKLSSGLRINKAADDASGMAIADSLRNQASSLGQAILNANDAIGIVQIADKAMDEQVKIIETIKVKATQAAQDGQTTDTRKALQADVTRLLEELDNIASTTSYNGQALLSGQYTGKQFQVGAYSNQTVKVNIGPTSSDKIGHARIETGQRITGAVSAVSLTFKAVDGIHDVTLESVKISNGSGSGIGVLAEIINKNSD